VPGEASETCDGRSVRGRPRVVIVGAGFAGLAAARKLARAPVNVTIVDRRNFHLFQPLLYQVATAALSPGDIAWPVRSIFRAQAKVSVVLMEVSAIDTVARRVGDGKASVSFDYLIIATGATHDYFGHEQWADFTCGLKTVEDARQLREKLLLACEAAELTDTLTEQRRYLTAVIVGGGATGVEMAGAMAELSRRTLRGEFRRIDPGTMRIVLVEAGPRVLPTFPPRLSERCRRSLSRMGVEVRTGSAVTGCDARGILIGELRIDAATVVWAAGVRASSAAQWLGAARDRANRVIVNPDLSVPGHSNIFVIGDTSSVQSPARPVPGVAPAAKQMGRYVGALIRARVRNQGQQSGFIYRHQGDLAVIGRKSAVVALGPLRLSGFPAWLFWCLIHVFFLIGFRSRVVVAFNWLWSFITRQRSSQLISDGPYVPELVGLESTRCSFRDR
jgi:NADH:ubiquinone reductase (H+-translocating)